MKRIVILGRGGSGKSSLARRLAEITKLPVIELDKIFWRTGLVVTAPDEWAEIQKRLADRDEWIMDGDLGPHDVIATRLRRADTVILLNYSLVRCMWNALRRSTERADFWRWVIDYRRKSLPVLRKAIARHAPQAKVHIFRSPRALNRFLGSR